MKKMKLIKSCLVAMTALTLFAASSQGQGLTLNFASLVGSTIQFNGSSDSFQFNNGASSSYQWSIGSEVGGSSAIGLLGSLKGGPFSYGPITTSGVIQTASVTGPSANLVISDGSANLSATVSLLDISTIAMSSGVENINLGLNVTGVTYSGSNPDLQFLVLHQPGSFDLSFQFAPGKNLTALSTGTGPYITSYSGSIASGVVPEPSTLALAGLGGLAGLLLRRRQSNS